MVWTGDSARHDNDEKFPRTEEQIHDLNRLCVNKFVEVFGKGSFPSHGLSVPVVPTWGNNDILPHNIFYPGPNKWTRAFLDIWRPFIPESQRHGFEYGGWFSVEVIPDKLAVLSLNSLYFYANNAAVDGCASQDEPGYAQFEWMRIQLQLLRERGVKAIMIGHVPPARTEGKTAWDETCWQKYTLWMRQYRDVVVGSAWGHMNIDHFALHDYKEVDLDILQGLRVGDFREAMGDEISIESTADYLTELREIWSELPEPPKDVSLDSDRADNFKKSKKEKFYEKIGGPFGERFSLSVVSPSVVPNYYPTLRLVEYNISGLDSSLSSLDCSSSGQRWVDRALGLTRSISSIFSVSNNKRKFKMPNSPSSTSPPGPAYSPQPLTWTKYTQLYANLTVINNDFLSSSDPSTLGWKEGKHPNEEPDSNPKPSPKNLTFEVEYDTANDELYDMKDLTIMSWLKLAERIGSYKPKSGNPWVKDDDFIEPDSSLSDTDYRREGSGCDRSDGGVEAERKHKKKKHKKGKHKKGKHKKRKLGNKLWHAFVSRAFVRSKSEDELKDQFGEPAETL